MGMSCSTNEFCRRLAAIVEGLSGVRKLVNNILVQGPTMAVLEERIRGLLDRCRESKFILCRKKFEIGTSVSFVGFKISWDGVQPQEDKAQGIRVFEPPRNVSELRSFLA